MTMSPIELLGGPIWTSWIQRSTVAWRFQVRRTNRGMETQTVVYEGTWAGGQGPPSPGYQ